MKIIVPIIAFLLLVSLCLAQTGEPVVLRLASGDVGRCEFYMYKKADGGTEGYVKLIYVVENSAKFADITGGASQKKVRILLNEKVIAEAVILKIEKGHSIQLQISAPDEALDFSKALMDTPNTPATTFPQMADVPVVAITSADVPRVNVQMFKDHTILEVSLNDERRAELMKTETENLKKRIRITLNGRPFAEPTITKPSGGRSVKGEIASMEEAFELAISLMNSTPKPGTL